jgi:ribosomal protein S18 acetylase RimI-like enzyme
MEDRRRTGDAEVALDGAALSIRPATRADRTFVRLLTVAAFARYGDYDAIMDGWLSDPRTRTVIAEVAGASAGFAMWACRAGHPTDVVLVSFALVPERRGCGLGRQLLTAVHRAIAGEIPGLSRRVTLDVAQDNQAARALFRRAGYHEVPGAEGSYPSGHPALRMIRELRAA